MKLFTNKFIQTLLFNLATIAAIVVGIVQFAIRAYKENNGNEKVRMMIQTVLVFINSNIERFIVQDSEPAPVVVPIRKVAQRRTKGA
jgi:hypothetical protein